MNAEKRLELTHQDIIEITDLSDKNLTDIKNNDFVLDVKTQELSLLFLRIYLSPDTITGIDM